MVIDIFKGTELYQSLTQYNKSLLEVCRGYKFIDEREYDLEQKEASWWFDPRKVRLLSISHVYPNTLPVQLDERLCLNIYIPNYVSLMVINKLCEDKNALIEDQAGGMGGLVYYLNKLGYTNFNLVDNFTQLPESLFVDNITKHRINCSLNDYSSIPKIINLIGYIYFPKKVSLDTDLLIVYNNTDIIKTKEDGIYYKISLGGNYALLENKVFLCKDNYSLTNIYCNKEKYEEFKNKLEEFKV